MMTFFTTCVRVPSTYVVSASRLITRTRCPAVYAPLLLTQNTFDPVVTGLVVIETTSEYPAPDAPVVPPPDPPPERVPERSTPDIVNEKQFGVVVTAAIDSPAFKINECSSFNVVLFGTFTFP